MVSILNYVLLGILFYIVVIPILEELATVIVQGLEVIKGIFIVKLNELQEKVKKDDKEKTKITRAIGFSISNDEEYEEDYEEDD